MQDDLLDTFGDQATFGKKIGGDILANKKTFLLINALEKGSDKQKSELLGWIEKDEYDAQEKIAAVTKIYDEVGVKKMAEERVDRYFEKAKAILHDMDLGDVVKQPLRGLADTMLTRKH